MQTQKVIMGGLFLHSTLLSACSDASLTKTNSIPTAEITYPADQANLLEGYPQVLRGIVGDSNHNFEDVLSTWLVDGQEVCSDVVPDQGGLSVCTTSFSLGNSEIALEVRDPDGASDTDYKTIVVVPTEAPIAEILEPTTGGLYYADRLITLHGIISDAEEASVDLQFTWESNIDGVLEGNFAQADSQGVILGASMLSAGEHFLRLHVVDSSGKDSRDSVTISVLDTNTAPICSIDYPIDGSIVASDQPLVFSGHVFDAQIPSTELHVQWSSDVDGILHGATVQADGSVLLAVSQLQVGTHTITLEATDESNLRCSEHISITVNSEPSAPTVSLFPISPITTDDITAIASGSVDPDGGTVTYEYAWFVDGQSVSTNSDILSNTNTNKHEVIRVEVTPFDGIGYGVMTYAQTTVLNAVPQIQNPSISATSAYVGDALVCSASAVDPDISDILNTQYSWTSGQTGPNYVVSAVDTVGSSITCTITVDDGDGGVAQSSVTSVVLNSDPVSSVVITPSQPSTTDILTCSANSSDANGHSLQHNFSWSVNGIPVIGTPNGATSSTLSYNFLSMDYVECSVSVVDGYGGATTSNATVTIYNSAPTITSINLYPNPLYTNDLVQASVQAQDLDGDAVTVTYDWYVDGVLVQGGANFSLDGAVYFDKHQQVEVYATVSDGSSTDMDSVSLQVSNSIPTNPSISIDPSVPVSGEGLQCMVDVGSVDDDGDSVSYGMSWDVDGQAYNSAYSTAYVADSIFDGVTQVAETWTCTVVANDGEDNSAPVQVSVTPCDAVLHFDGSNDQVLIPNLNSMPGNQTMEAWVNLAAPPSAGVQLMSSECGGLWITPTEIHVFTINNCMGNSGGCKSGYNNNSTWVANNRPGGDGGFLYTGWDGSWKHVAVTINTSHVAKLYIDGTLFGSATLSSDGCMSAVTLATIGRHNVYGSAILGDIASVRMSSAIEYTTNFTPQYPLAITSNTKVLYGLQGDVGTMNLTDESGHGYTANIVDASWSIGGPMCE